MKYLKITLILFGICLICALATAGVNMFTAPKIAEYKEEQKMAAYLELFPEMSASNSEFINSGFSSSYVKEKCIVKDANGNDLGYGFQVSGANTYGTITLIVALDNEGNLLSIKATENGQTGGRNTMINEYIAGFTAGMTAEDVANRDVYAGATYGSNLVKNLLAAAFAEAGIMSPTQELLVGIFGDSVDMGQTVEDTQFIYAQQVKVGYEVKDSAGTVLGYYYEVNVTNKFGNINLGVALNNDYTLKQVEAIEIVQKPYGEVDTNEITSEFVGGMTANSSYDDISNLTPVAGATYSTTSAKVAILVAMKEAQNTFDETLALRIMFNKDYASTSDLKASVSGVDKYQDVLNAESTSIGKAVTVAGSNNFGPIKLYIGINSNNTLAGIFIIENGQTNGRADSLTDYIPQFTTGMTGEEAVSEGIYSGATVASNTTLDLIATAFEQVTGERPVKTYNAYYKEAFGEDANLISIEEFKREEVIDGVFAVDKDGNVLGSAYIIRVENTYGYNVMCVVLNENGTYKDVIDVENNHSNVDSWLDENPGVFNEGMTSNQISNIKYDTVADGSFTIESIRLSILIAMDEFKGASSQAVTDEIYIKKFFNNAVYGRAVLVESNSTTRIYDVYGSANYQDGVLIGHVYFISNEAGEEMINTVIAFDANNKYLGSYYIGTGINIGMYEDQIKAVFANADINTSVLEEQLIASDVKIASTIKDTNSQTLGYFFIVTGENTFGVITLGVGIDTEGKLVGISIIENGQTNGKDEQIAEYITQFTAGMTAEEVANVPVYAGATYGSNLVKELLAKAFSLASELSGNADTPDNLTEYDDKIKQVFSAYDISTSKVITDIYNKENVELAVEIKNSLDMVLGYAYVIYLTNMYGDSSGNLGYNRILVTLDENNNFNKILDLGNNHSNVEEWIEKNPDVFKEGMSANQINNIKYDAVSDASYTIETIKLAIKIAMQERLRNESDTTLYETVAKVVFPGIVVGRSEVLTNLPEGVKFGYRVVGDANSEGNPTQNLGYFLVVTEETRFGVITLGIGIDTESKLVGISAIEINQRPYGNNDTPTMVKDFIAQFTAGMTAEEVAAVETTANATVGTTCVKNLLAKAFSIASEYNQLYTLIKDVFPTFNAIKSPYFLTSDIYNADNVLFALTLNEEVTENNESTKLNTLGYAYVVYLTNIYGDGSGNLGYNKILVIINADNTFNKVFDFGNNHSDVDTWIEENPNVFTSGMNIDDINNIKYDAVSDASYTIETIKLAIKIAMQERLKNENDTTLYEAVAKEVFPGIVVGRSEVLTNLPEGVKFGYRVVGDADGNGISTQNLGYFLVVTGENKFGVITLGVGIDTEGKLVGISIIENGQTGGRATKIVEYITQFTAGMTADEVAAVETTANATVGTQLVKELLAKAFSASETLKGGNN